MSNKTKVLKASLTGVGGILGASIAVLVVGTLMLAPLPQYVGTPPSLELSPVPSEQRRVCQGPLVQVSSDKTATVSYLSNGPVETMTDSTSVSVQATNLQMTDNKAPASLGAPNVISIPADKAATTQPLLAGTQTQYGVGEALAGLALSSCADSSSDMWLVAGATDVGRTSLLMLTNPTSVSSTVKLEIFGEKGLVEGLKSDGILVPAGTQRIISLAGYARDVVAPVVHVTSTGGQILASMQQSVTRTLVPSGVELVNPGTAPNTMQVMTGVYLQGQAEQSDGEHGAVLSDLESAIRVLIPGNADAEVTITTISAIGETTELKAPMKAKTVVQYPFLGLKDGVYTVVVRATQPVVAATRAIYASAPQATSGGDFAWFSSGAYLTNSLLLPVPNVPTPQVSLYNPTEQEVTVTISARNEQDIKLTVAPESMTVTPVKPLVKYTVKGTKNLFGMLTAAGTGVGSAMSLNPANALGSAVQLYPR